MGLQGCRNEREWDLLSNYLQWQYFVETQFTTWHAAARLYFDLRRKGLSIRNPIDCCIAQLAIENNLLLLHDDRDFITISQHVPLKQKLWQTI